MQPNTNTACNRLSILISVVPSNSNQDCPSSEATRETSEEVRRETLRLIEATEVKTDNSLLESHTQ